MEAKMHLKGCQKVIQNEVGNGHENREGKGRQREGHGAKMNPKRRSKMAPKPLKNEVQNRTPKREISDRSGFRPGVPKDTLNIKRFLRKNN